MTLLESLNSQYLAMPPVAAMGVRAVAFDGEALLLHAPLAANINDKGSAFGGSMAGMMTLAGWGLLTLKLDAAGMQADVYVADSQIRYLRPLQSDLHAQARLEPTLDWNVFLETFRQRGKARASVLASLNGPDGECVAELTGRFAALRQA